jgi:hypothetical protein
MLLGIWVAEERRLGVVHESGTGAGARELKKNPAAPPFPPYRISPHRPAAAVSNLERPLDGGDAAVRGRAALAAATGGTAAASPQLQQLTAASAEGSSGGGDDAGSAAAGDPAAFRTLRRALPAAELWRLGEGSKTVSALGAATSRVDLRHKLYAVLAGWDAAGVGAEDGANGGGDDEEDGVGGVTPAVDTALPPPERVTLELVRAHEPAVLTGAWRVRG